jgi:hypothetical protein
VRAGPHIPEADEGLKALVEAFRASGGQEGSEALADALLSRGHAGEARLIAEHGLAIDALNDAARVVRAAALLAQGHTRMAYVELVRTLAIDPTNHRGLRLLGRVYLDAGLPERAAQLLAQRYGAQQSGPRTRAPSTVDARPLFEWVPEASARATLEAARPAEPSKTLRDGSATIHRSSVPKSDAPAGTLDGGGTTDILDLFASLTRDLGLGPTEAVVPTKVEVTQVMRLRRPRAPTLDEALSTIDGPIVDTTQPGRLEAGGPAPDPNVFAELIQPPPSLGGLDDEPLFGEAVRASSATVEADTYDEQVEAPLPPGALADAIQAETTRLSTSMLPRPAASVAPAPRAAAQDLATEIAIARAPGPPAPAPAASTSLPPSSAAGGAPPTPSSASNGSISAGADASALLSAGSEEPAYLKRFERQASRDAAVSPVGPHTSLRERPLAADVQRAMWTSALAALAIVALVAWLASGALAPWLGG